MKPIYTIDVETDPFVYGRSPQPFACGLYTGDTWKATWGQDCIEKMHEHLMGIKPGIIFAHNGGKFDFFFMMDWLKEKSEILIINGRIVKANMWGVEHELRDSFALMPFALKVYKKERIDYRCFEAATRDQHKREILRYLKQDCVYLHELCVEFFDRFGDNLTIASTSMKQMKKLYTFECLTKHQDEPIRESFYFGGRVQCFEKGVIKPSKGAQIIAYDLNQCYPYAMRNFQHPISLPDTSCGREITENTFFLSVIGTNHGAFPVRRKDGLHFDVEYGQFDVTIHEFNAAIETGLFECEDVIRTHNFSRSTTFQKFVDKFHTLRRDAQLKGDDVGALFYKYVGNSCYGKFAQNPDQYRDFMITNDATNANPEHDPDGWVPSTLVAFAGYVVWSRPTQSNYRYNIATAASITGAARSLLIRALAKAKRPLYCDTDSIVCEWLDVPNIDATKLGHWKIEKTGNKMAIAGRKLYALFDRQECVKMASKGVHLTADEIVQVASGHKVTWKKDAPTFNFRTHSATFIERTVRMT
jgi:DNA polymerase elongation subunit (family B)